MGLAEAVPSIGSCVAGLLFGAAWLLWIDGVAFAAAEYGEAVNGAYWVPGILQTIGLLMVNLINWSLLTDDSMMDDGGVAVKVKAWVFVSFVFCFSGLIGSVWILVQEMQHPSWEAGGGAVDSAVRCLLQNLFLFGSEARQPTAQALKPKPSSPSPQARQPKSKPDTFISSTSTTTSSSSRCSTS